MRLFGSCRHNVYATILSLLPHTSDAEEVLQETTFVLWSKFNEFQADGDFSRWACGIAYNQARRFRRDVSRAGVQFSEALMERIAVIREENLELLEARRRVLADCLQKLSVRDRELIDHYQTVGISVKQIAERLGRPVNTAYKALKRIRLALFECVDETLLTEGKP